MELDQTWRPIFNAFLSLRFPDSNSSGQLVFIDESEPNKPDKRQRRFAINDILISEQ